MPHLLRITDLNRVAIERLLDRARYLLDTIVKPHGQLPVLTGQAVANLFFEPSTRTQYSFAIAAHRLGALVLNPVISHTSTVKGESLLDTVRTFIAMGAQLLVIRHREDNTPMMLANAIQDQASIINGGDGCNEHPTQALLDLFTIRQYKEDFSALTVAIIGDIAHSRVARSLVAGLNIMGCKQIRLIAPAEFLPHDIHNWVATPVSSLAEGIAKADVIVTLRIQLERITLPPSAPDPAQFLEKFRLTEDNLRLANPQAIVMHPAPLNREIEITSTVADGPQSVIWQQMTNGVAMRMAVIEWLLESLS